MNSDESHLGLSPTTRLGIAGTPSALGEAGSQTFLLPEFW
jgi:hypothetical protein